MQTHFYLGLKITYYYTRTGPHPARHRRPPNKTWEGPKWPGPGEGWGDGAQEDKVERWERDTIAPPLHPNPSRHPLHLPPATGSQWGKARVGE
jgi:hypothetical protein